MKKNLILQSSAILIFVILYGCSKSRVKKEYKQPNIVFIMCDDHAYQAISAYGKGLMETPNIDRIAKMGMLFTDASVTNSLCAPSRATILTGKFSHINGKIDNHSVFDTTNVTFPELLHHAGYQTAIFGKLHFGNNPKGFDQFKILPGQGAYYNPDFITKDNKKIKVNGYVTDIVTDMSLNWLKEERDPNKPFLLMYLNKAPHRPWVMAERHMQEYTNKIFPEPKTLFDNYLGREAAGEAEMSILKNMSWSGDNKIFPEVMDQIGLPEIGYDKLRYASEINRMNPSQLKNFKSAYSKINEDFKKKYATMTDIDKMKWRYQRYMQDYCGTLKSVDENVGRLLDYLEENKLMENTIIVYTSDQGMYLGEHGWFDKRFVYDESFKTPLLIAWSGMVKPGTKSNELVQNLDFAQTFLDAAHVPHPKNMQGQSLVPLLSGHLDKWTKREAVYYSYYEYPAEHMVKRHYAIITKKYKLIHYYFDIDRWELIDRVKDPNELINFYDDPSYSEIRKRLQDELRKIRIKYKDSDELNQKYIDKFFDDKVYDNIKNINQNKLKEMLDRRSETNN